jgi:mRNA interferase MazF
MNVDRGDLVLVSLVFSDQSGAKLRPVLVISSAAYHRSRPDAIVAAVTSNVRRRLVGDHRVRDWKASGLLLPSVVTGVIRTIQRTMIARKLGVLAAVDFTAVERQLRASLAL